MGRRFVRPRSLAVVWRADKDENGPKATTAEDMHSVLSCWTRRNILVALSGPRRDAGTVAAALGIRANLLSNHTKALARLGLASFESEGLRHFWSLRPAARIQCESEGVLIELTAKDGCRVGHFIPWTSGLIRLLSAGLRAGGYTLPRPGGSAARPTGTTPGTPAHARMSDHRANGPG